MLDEPSPPTDVLFNFKSELQSIIASCLSGARYGVKIRLPHALLMTMLFKRGMTAQQKLKIILKLTLDHSCSLAAFATVYKVGQYLYLLRTSPYNTVCSKLFSSDTLSIFILLTVWILYFKTSLHFLL